MKPLYIKIVAIAGLISLACTTKVSEWVLLNALPNQYTLIYFHRNKIAEKASQENAEINKNISGANIQFSNILKDDVDKPYYALYYGKRLFSKYTDPIELNNLISSPIRDKVAGEIKAGKLCVLLYLRADLKDKDDNGLQVVRKTIAASPFNEIIPVVELSRSNKAEAHFISMLLNVESDLKDIREPMLFGIFGRFKALEPLVAGGITEENINLMIDFLTADCSCLIKDDLPGTDILYINRWESPDSAMLNAILDANPSLMHK
jgi:hypothetical protein